MFDKLGDLFQLSVLPKVLCITKGWRGPNTEATVEKNDILIVKGLRHRKNHRYLKAICLKSKENKELPESCGGSNCHLCIKLCRNVP